MPSSLVNEPFEIAQNTWWVGRRDPGQIFYANPYLRAFTSSAGASKEFNLLIDPGANKDFAMVRSKTERVLGDFRRVSGIFINHQDPDVGSAVGLILGRHVTNAHVLCSEDTWRLVQYYNVPRERFVAVERYPNGIRFPNDERLIPVGSPFCHFVGAYMLYDPQTRVLFTGDLFGGLTDRDAEGLWAQEGDWAGMRAFHQIYMPTNKALRIAIDRIRALTPAVEMIAPQHGRVIRGALIEQFMERLERLPVGLDIIEDRFATPEELGAWSEVLERVLRLAEDLGASGVRDLVMDDSDARDALVREGRRIRITSLGRTTLQIIVRGLCDRLPADFVDPLRYEAVTAAAELDLPTPNIELDEGDDSPRGNPLPAAFASAE